MASFLRLNLFPAQVEVGDTVYKSCRAVVTDDAVHVYVDSPEGPAEAYTARLDDFIGSRSGASTATVDGGTTVTINRASGCGCGSRLRGFRPFPGVQVLPM